jgi:ankyrin repeat protein
MYLKCAPVFDLAYCFIPCKLPIAAARYGRVGTDVLRKMIGAPRGKEALGWGERGHSRSPLHEAVWHGHVEVVRVLLESHVDPNLVEDDGGSPLHEAAYRGSYGHAAERMRQKQKSETKRPYSENEHRTASECESARLEILELLLDSGRCIVDLGETHGCTPLWYAAGAGDGWSRGVVALINAGANVNPGEVMQLPHKKRRGPASPLMYAIDRGNYEIAMILLKRGARVPPSCDLASLLPQLPDDLAEELNAPQQEVVTSVGAQGQGHGIVGYQYATKCGSVPDDAFAQPPVKKSKD